MWEEEIVIVPDENSTIDGIFQRRTSSCCTREIQKMHDMNEYWYRTQTRLTSACRIRTCPITVRTVLSYQTSPYCAKVWYELIAGVTMVLRLRSIRRGIRMHNVTIGRTFRLWTVSWESQTQLYFKREMIINAAAQYLARGVGRLVADRLQSTVWSYCIQHTLFFQACHNLCGI